MQPEQTFKFTLERPSYPYRTVLVPWSHEITQRREAKRLGDTTTDTKIRSEEIKTDIQKQNK